MGAIQPSSPKDLLMLAKDLLGKGEYERALQCLKRVLVAEDKDIWVEIVAHSFLCSYYFASQDFKNLVSQANKVITLGSKNNDVIGQASGLISLALAYLVNEKQPNQAYHFCTEALNLLNNIPIVGEQIRNIGVLAAIHWVKEEEELAIKQYSELKKLLDLIPDKMTVSYILQELNLLYEIVEFQVGQDKIQREFKKEEES
ncbi:MAG: tetratricopeptide repeat protein [Candidatus Hermodarchaeota archaeon]